MAAETDDTLVPAFEYGGMILRVVTDPEPRLECLMGAEWHASHLPVETLDDGARRISTDELEGLLGPQAASGGGA